MEILISKLKIKYFFFPCLVFRPINSLSHLSIRPYEQRCQITNVTGIKIESRTRIQPHSTSKHKFLRPMFFPSISTLQILNLHQSCVDWFAYKLNFHLKTHCVLYVFSYIPFLNFSFSISPPHNVLAHFFDRKKMLKNQHKHLEMKAPSIRKSADSPLKTKKTK